MKKIRLATLAMSIVLVLAQLMAIAIPVSAAGATAADIPAPLFADSFQFIAPEESDACIVESGLGNYSGDFTGKSTDNPLLPLFSLKNWQANLITTAYLAYKVTNNSTTDAVCVGTGLTMTTRSEAGKDSNNGANVSVLAALAYNAETGEQYKTSYEYTTDKTLKAWYVPTVEIPAGETAYIVIPFSSLASNAINSFPVAEGENFARDRQPEKGVLWCQDAAQAAGVDRYLDNYKAGMVKTMYIFLGGNADPANNTRTFSGNCNLTFSGVYAVSKANYNARYNAKYGATNLQMEEGAGVRMNAQTGIRFTANVNMAYYEWLTASYGAENVSYGTLITPKHYAEAAGAVTFDALNALDSATWGATKYLDIPATGFFKEGEKTSTIAGSLVGIKETHYKWEYSAVCYIKIVDGENVIYLYASDAQSRSISWVAERAVDDRKPSQQTGYGNNLNDGHAKGNWSPYTADQIKLLKSFYAAS